ncbi:asparaginase [Hasllibacter halocynthiae]
MPTMLYDHGAVPICRAERGGRVESVHLGHAVVVGPDGVREAWGDPSAAIFPRSSCKMFQALPMLEAGLDPGPERLALACASHDGAAIHTGRVGAWMRDLGLSDDDFRCGAHEPKDRAARDALIRSGEGPRQVHNNCSGKHAGFLAMTKHLGAGPDYVDPGHPLQRAVRAAFEEVTGEESPGYGIDGCSAPNFVCTLEGLARGAMRFATAREGDARGRAMIAAREAMMRHPDLVAGEGRACTVLMRATSEPVALKTGAEGVFLAILPGRGLGVAVKAADGATRAAESAVAEILVRLGALDPAHPGARAFRDPVQRNWRGIETGRIAPAL